MKHLTSMTAVVAVLLVTGVADAAITGSKHDFSGSGWARGEVCLPCHAPHNAIVRDAEGKVLAGPLWNHTLSTATYTLYVDHDTGQAVTGAVDTNSKLCLSCHDGTVALDSFGGMSGSNVFIGNNKANVGTDLSNDHPIGEAAIWPNPEPSHMVPQASRDSARIMPLRPMGDGRRAVGCTSCHEPHNRKSTEHMLWVANTGQTTTVDGRVVNGSGLCFNCHKK